MQPQPGIAFAQPMGIDKELMALQTEMFELEFDSYLGVGRGVDTKHSLTEIVSSLKYGTPTKEQILPTLFVRLDADNPSCHRAAKEISKRFPQVRIDFYSATK